MNDMTPFEELFEERIRAFARTGVKSVDSAEVARAAAVGTQRRPRRIPWGFGGARTIDRWPVAAAAVIVVIVVGGALFMLQRRQPAVIAVPTPTPSAEPSPSLRGVVPPPSSIPTDEPSAGPTSSSVPGRAGSWVATGSMGERFVRPGARPGRSDHAAVRLLDGRVLVAGGGPDETTPPRSCTTRSSGTWSATGNMARPRESTGFAFGAILLRDGRVLVGDDQGAEVYDPEVGDLERHQEDGSHRR